MTIEERMEKMERELTAAKRRNRWLLGAGALLIVGCLAIAATPGDNQTVRARKFEVVDEQGRTRIILDVKDGPRLGLCDENGKSRIGLAVLKEGPGLVMLNENGKPRIALAAGKDRTELGLTDANGKSCASFTVTKDGTGLVLQDANGIVRAGMAVYEDGRPGLTCFDENKKQIWSAP